MKTYLLYGLGTAAACFVWTIAEDLLGLHGARIALGTYSHYGLWAITFAGLWLGVRAARESAPERPFTYGRGFGAGAAITGIQSIVTFGWMLLFLLYINPGFPDTLRELQRQKLAAKGIDEAQIDKVQNITHFLMQPVPMAAITFISALILGIVFSLVIAAFLQRARPLAAAEAVPPPL
jgi:hypothetical protein